LQNAVPVDGVGQGRKVVDYSLRVMMYLAVKYPQDGLATIDEIAASYDISRAHLMKIVHELGQNGFIETVRGRTGGIRLARAPREISIGDLVRSTEKDFAVVPCHSSVEEAHCAILPACNLKKVLRRAVEAFMEELDEVTLAETITIHSVAASLLRLSTPVGAIPVVVAAGPTGGRRPAKSRRGTPVSSRSKS
jgi:Rrf2 family nitric oxide-sensitive transcriptional repressor